MTAAKSPRSQTKLFAVLRALRRGAGLTALQAVGLGELHLASSVYALRRMGYVIEAQWHSGVSRYGNRPIRFKKYHARLNK